MNAAETAIMLALTFGLAYAGWNCLYKTDYLVKMHRKQFQKAAGVRFYPFASLVVKPWYPAYLRGCGLAIWLCDVVFIYLIWFRRPAF